MASSEVRGTITPDAVAAAVGGTWINPAPPTWQLSRVVKAQTAHESTRMRGVLVPVRNPGRWLERLEDSGLPDDAAVLLVQDDLTPEQSRFPMLKVEAIEDALTTLATTRRNEFGGKVVAVTGSVGKTSTTAMIGAALSTTHETYCARRTENDLITVRKHCIRFTDEEYAVVEISRLGLPDGAFVLRPDVAVVTAISEAHMNDMGSLEGTARFKAQIFAGMNTGGTVVVNADTPHADILLEEAREHAAQVITYGTDSATDVRLVNYDPQTDTVEIDYLGTPMLYQIGNPGTHNALNSVATLCAIGALGEDVANFAETFASFKAGTGRGATSELAIGRGQVTLVDQSYNANPLSVRAALADFRARFTDSRRVLVLGEMLELGPTEDTLHAELLEPVLQAEPTLVYAVGPLMEHLWTRLPEQIRGAHLTTVAQVKAVLETDLQDGDAVLIKASRATGLHEFVTELTSGQDQDSSEEPPAGTPPASGSEQWRVTISGPAVHGVGFRRAVRSKARSLNVRGWVRNRSDGKVEALAAGDAENLAQLHAYLHSGPDGADVDRVVAWKVSTVPRAGFRIRRRRKV